jgi:hypothetical protein
MRKSLFVEITIGAIAVIGMIALVYTKVIDKPKIEYTVYYLEKYNVCFLVDPLYSITQFRGGLFYGGGKNTGTMKIFQRDMDPSFKAMPSGDIPMSIHKIKNLRILEYLISEKVVLRDEFEFVKRIPGNLVPRRNGCDVLMKKFKTVKIDF